MITKITRIDHKYTIPKNQVYQTFSKINKTQLSFGVHSTENNSHSLRDAIQRKPMHKAFYGNSSNIGNAALLNKLEKGFSTDVWIGGMPRQMEVPPRPILIPLMESVLKTKSIKSVLKSCIKEDLKFKNKNEIKRCFLYIGNKLNIGLLKFIKNRGGKYWTKEAKHNSPYTAAIKFLETLGQSGLDNVYNYKSKTINYIYKWGNAGLYKQGDMPLQDSLDLINSIKAKIK